MAARVPNIDQVKKMGMSLNTSGWVAIFGLAALLLLVALHFGFRPLNVK